MPSLAGTLQQAGEALLTDLLDVSQDPSEPGEHGRDRGDEDEGGEDGEMVGEHGVG